MSLRGGVSASPSGLKVHEYISTIRVSESERVDVTYLQLRQE